MKPSPGPVRYNDAAPARVIGRYPVVRLLGTGGFSAVYLARDDRLDTDVAIKVLAENWCADPDISRRFVEEARLLRRCDDERVVRVHTIEQLEDGRPYFVMDFADAGTLADRMLAAVDVGRPFGVRESVALARELADCLTVVHDNGIVHRDLKPSNVLFRTTRAGERMVLGDFGLARQMLASSGKTILAGTPEYIAPEQADRALAATVDERADVYAAAVILHELLTGAVPFGYASFDEAAAARQRAPDLAVARPGVPPAVAAAVARGMAADREDRFPSGRAWLAALGELLAALPADDGAPARPALAPVPRGAAGVGVALPSPMDAAMAPAALTATPTGTSPVAPTVGAGVPAPTAPQATASAPSGRKPLWPLFAGVLGALALVAALAVVVGRSGGNGSQAAGPEPTLPRTTVPGRSAPTTPAPATTVPVPVPSGPAAWFAAISPGACRPAGAADKLPGVVAAIGCTYPGVQAVFGEASSAANASAFLARLHQRRAGSVEVTWSGGQAVLFGGDTSPAIAWGYTGQPYVAIAMGQNRAALEAWWASTGRVVRNAG